MVMVPIASWISLFSVEGAFFIDAIRDVYEARLLSSFPHFTDSEFLYEQCVNLGIRHLLLFRPPTFISSRRTLITHPSTRKTTKGTHVPCQLVQPRD